MTTVSIQRKRKRRIPTYQLVLGLLLSLLAIVCVYPMWYTLITSFSNKSHVAAGLVVFLPSGFNTLSYQKVLADKLFFSSFLVSVERTVLGCALNMILLSMAAYALSLPQDKFPARKYYVWFFMFNMLFSGGTIPWYLLIRDYGLMNSIWALVLPMAFPIYDAILLMNFFKNVPLDMRESAMIDGASSWRILWSIYLPVSLPALATVMLFCFVSHWNSWFDGLILIGKTEMQPLQTYIYQLNANIDYQRMSSEEIRMWSQVSSDTLNAAKIIVALIPILCIYPFLQRYFVVGLTLGAVKE